MCAQLSQVKASRVLCGRAGGLNTFALTVLIMLIIVVVTSKYYSNNNNNTNQKREFLNAISLREGLKSCFFFC